MIIKPGQVHSAAIVAEKRRSKDKRVEQAFRPAVRQLRRAASAAEVTGSRLDLKEGFAELYGSSF
jgi:hypothetical protein